MPPQRRGRHRDEGEHLARLRRTWHDAYDIPEPRRRRWQRPVLAARNRQTSVTITARSADVLEQRILDDYARGIGPADRTAWPAQNAAPPAAEPPAAFSAVPPPDGWDFSKANLRALASDEGWPDDGMRTSLDLGGPLRMNRSYAGDDNQWRLS